MRGICWWCGGKLIWQSDFSEGESMVTYLTCSECDAEIEYTTGTKE